MEEKGVTAARARVLVVQKVQSPEVVFYLTNVPESILGVFSGPVYVSFERSC